MHWLKVLAAFSVILVMLPVAGAKLIENPEAVSYLKADLVKGGSILIEPESPLARANALEVYLSIPQNSSRQVSVLKGVEGPDYYAAENDEWGNEILRLRWENPPVGRNIPYSVSFGVEVLDRTEPAQGKSFKTTGMTKPSLAMTEEAYNLVSGLNGMKKLFRLTEWVYNWVDYRSEYQNLPKSAEWVFENRKGICSSNSNLLISLLRSTGFNAYYVIGYAYTEETPGSYWGPHGWVEAEYEGETVSLDPTWLESPVDSTHIRFANAPDSNYTERAEIIGSQVRLVWRRDEPVIDMVKKEDSERVRVNAGFIPDEAGGESYALLLTGVSSGISSECVLGYMQLQSCSMGDSYFLEVPVRNQTLAFCGSDTLLWFVKTPRLRGNMIYTCPVSVYTAGTVKKPQLKVRNLPEEVEVRMSTPKVLTPGQPFTVETIVENHGFSARSLENYLIFGDVFQSRELELASGYQAELTWSLQAPQSPGSVKLSFFSSSGDLLEEELTVISARHMRIESISMPDNMTLKDSVFINVTVIGLEQIRGELQLRIDGDVQTREFYIDRDEVKSFTFSYTPASEGNREIGVILLSDGQYEDGVVGNLLVTGESEWWEQVLGAVTGFLKWIASLFGF